VGEDGAGAEDAIRELYERFNAGDREGAFDRLHPECEFHQNPDFPGDRIHRGREGFQRGLDAFLTEWDEFRFEPVELASGENVWMRVRIGGRGRASGVPVELEVFHVWELRDGTPFRCRVFLEEGESRLAAGLA
jgi:ketosteroid isomerase-like protein